MNTRRFIVSLIGGIAFTAVPVRSVSAAQESSVGVAQSGGTIEGRVFNPATGEDVSNAEVGINGTSLLNTTTTEGRDQLTNVPSGNVTMTVRYAGYPNATAHVAITTGGKKC